MSIIIHKTSVSPPARATLMIVNILNLKIETREVSLLTREQFRPEYIKKNPLHTVPLLEDGDFILADSHAIITYLVSKYGTEEHASLYPKNLQIRATIDQRLFFNASILFPHLKNVIYSLVAKSNRLTKEEENKIIESYGFLEQYLEKTSYVAADFFTVADVSCVSTISSMNSIVPLDRKFVKILLWWKKLEKEHWYQEENVPGMKLFDGFIKQFLIR